jgi:hypothetical protein
MSELSIGKQQRSKIRDSNIRLSQVNRRINTTHVSHTFESILPYSTASLLRSSVANLSIKTLI